MSSQNGSDGGVVDFTNIEAGILRLAAAAERIAAAAEQANGQARDGMPKVSREAEAMAWCYANRVTDRQAIASRFGVSMRTIRRWKKLLAMLDGIRAGDPRKSLLVMNSVVNSDG